MEKVFIRFIKLKSIWLVLIFNLLTVSNNIAQQLSYYQLKIYKLENSSQVNRMETYLKDAFIPALHRAGITTVGVFRPITEDSISDSRIFVLIPFMSLDQFDKLPEILGKDKKYLSDGKDYIDALYNNPPYKRFESILLKAFKGMPGPGIPEFNTPPSARVYELRSYQGATEQIYQRKVHMFNEGGEIRLFKDLDFNPVFFAEVISGGIMPNLMYMTSFSDINSQKEHWKAFQNHPDWNAMKNLEKYQNTVSHIDIVLLYSTEYSDF